MIRTAGAVDVKKLEDLYRVSIYDELPGLVRWALVKETDRVFLAEENGDVFASVYTMICGYYNLWASYLVFKEGAAGKLLVEYLLSLRKERGARNLYVFCPREFIDARVHLISLGFVPEWTGKIDELEYIVESHSRTFDPIFPMSPSQDKISVDIDRGHSNDSKVLARILHASLPRDFSTIMDATSCVKKWFSEMPEDIFVARNNGSPVGVLLLSREIYPVLDDKLAMLCYIAVEEEYRGKGVGRALVKEACDVLRRTGKNGLEVDVSVGNLPARIFYTKVGFYPYWYSRGYMRHDDGIFYRKDLENKTILFTPDLS